MGPVRLLLVALGAGVAALVAVTFTSVNRDVGPGSIVVEARPAILGRSVLEFPPLGRVRADTHVAPLAVTLRVDELDIERLQALLDEEVPEDALRHDVEEDVEPLVRSFALRAVIVAFGAGALVGALAPGRGVVSFLVGGVAGALVVAGLLFATWRDFDPRAFEEPSYEGALERAPQVIEAVGRHVEDLDEIRDRVEVVGNQISSLYALASGVPLGPTGDEVRILHVSDIHSNPLGVEIARDLAARFEVDAVLDTGDLTSFGHPVEAKIGELVADIDAPYYFVPGNHDSDANKAAIDAVPNVTLVDEDVVDIRGVRVLGVADPTFTATNEIDSEEAAAVREQHAPEVARLVATRRPHLLAVHDRRLASASLGDVPVVVSGHNHKRASMVEEDTLVLTVGSSGATGLGSFTVEQGIAYEAQLLHFDDEGTLRLVDYFWLEGITGNYRIERQVLDDAASEDEVGDGD